MDVIYDIEKVKDMALTTWKEFAQYKIWALHGDMGVGKTTFTHMLVKTVLQSEDNVSSPTFSIINQYISPLAGKICHIDLYRLSDEEEAFNAGVEDAVQSADLSIIEWPDIASGILDPAQTINLYFTLEDDGRRRLRTNP